MSYRSRVHVSAALLGLTLFTSAVHGPAPARGEEVDPELTITQAVEIALARNHEVRQAREQLARLEGEILVVKSDVYPQVGLEADYSRRYDESILDNELGDFISPEIQESYGVRGTVDQLLFSWGRVSTAVEIAEDSRRRSRKDLVSVIREVKLRVHEVFYELLLNQRLVEVAEETLALRQRQLEVAEKKFQAGVVNEFEVIRARVDVANAKPPVIRALNQVQQSISRLNNVLARDQGAPLKAEGELEYHPLADLTLEEVVRRAVDQRPELASLRVAEEIAEKSLKIAHAEDKLQVNLRGEYGFAADTTHELSPNREVWSAGVLFSMPLFDGWRTRGRVVQASSELQQTRIRKSRVREDITLEANVVLDNLRVAEEIIKAASLTIEQAESALELAETSYRYGVATALDVSDAQLSLTVARTDHARALHDYMLAKARVLSVMNEL